MFGICIMNRPQIVPGKIDIDLSDELNKLRETKHGGGGDIDSVFAHAALIMEPAFVSLAVYAYVLLLCELIGRQIVARNLPTTYQRYALEFCATLQGCLCVFENGAFRRFYGGTAYIMAASSVSFVNRSLKRGAYANPASLTEATLMKGLPVRTYAGLLVCELLAGMCAYRFSWLFWSMRMHATHDTRYSSNYACVTDLTVPIWLGVVWELCATLIDQFLESIFAQRSGARTARWCGGVLCAVITQIGLAHTGMYFNPILATTVTYGCAGLDTGEHLLIYWLGPIVGQIAGTRLYERFAAAPKDELLMR